MVYLRIKKNFIGNLGNLLSTPSFFGFLGQTSKNSSEDAAADDEMSMQ